MAEEVSRPEWPSDWERQAVVLEMLAPLEYGARWCFHIFKISALVRFIIEVGIAAALFAGVWGLFEEFEERKIDRGVRVATLFAQIAQTHALPDKKGLIALKPSVEALAREGVSMPRIVLSEASLQEADLSMADLSEANLDLVLRF